MKKKIIIALTSFVLFSCNSEQIISDVSTQTTHEETQIREFKNKESFIQAVEHMNLDKIRKTRAGDNFISAEEIYSETEDGKDSIEQIGFILPDERYRNILNKDLEVIVNDTLYKVTNNGTFYSHRSFQKELEKKITDIQSFKDINKNLKRNGNIFLINTFNNWSTTTSDPIKDLNYFEDDSLDVIIENKPQTRSVKTGGITREEIEKFPIIGTTNVKIVDKIMRMSPGYLNHTKLRFNFNPKRKLYVSLYRYDYGFGVTIGLDCKVMKKMWYGGWARVKYWDPGIYYGLSALIIKQPIKDVVFDKFIENYNHVLKRQWNTINTHKYPDYMSAVRDFNNGILNKWSTEYNSKTMNNKFIIPVIGEDVTEIFGSKPQAISIYKSLEKFLHNKGLSFFSKIDTSESGKEINYLSERERAFYIIYSNDITWNGGGYRLKETFLKYYRNISFNVSFNLNGHIDNLSGNAFHDNEIFKQPEISFCEGVVYTKDGDGWLGVRISKDTN